jgi:hypothetical protein
MKNWLISTLLLIAFTCLLVSCSEKQVSTGSDPFEGMHLATLTGNSTSAASSTLTPLPSGVLISDDFSDPNSGWEDFSGSDGSAGYENDTYTVVATKKSLTEWGANSQTFTDLKIDVDIHAVNADDNENNSFGVDCRIQDNGDGYSFEISSDGEYAIVKYENEKYFPLVDWTESFDIPTGDQTTHLTALCQGDNLQLWVNNIPVAQTTDSSFSSGRISLSATTFDASLPARVESDNLIITNPVTD